MNHDQIIQRFFCCLVVAVSAILSACGGGDSRSDAYASNSATANLATAAIVRPTLAAIRPGVTPFISFVDLNDLRGVNLSNVRYQILSKPNAASQPVRVSYSAAALVRRGNLVMGETRFTIPVFGLYAGYGNDVEFEFSYVDGTTSTLKVRIPTAPYTDPKGVYDHPSIVQQRAAGSDLGFDFFVIKSALGSPVVIDTDAEIRWVASTPYGAFTSAFVDNGFLLGDPSSSKIIRIELDGAISQNMLSDSDVIGFHHNLDFGKVGIFAEVNTQTGTNTNLESTLVEFLPSTGVVAKRWDFAALIGDYMRSNGDNPLEFIQPGRDWFHMNSAIYDPRDDSVIVSSRENFVIKVDYASGKIIWILGDPNKYWYSFASLRAKALTLAPGGLYPIGQHALSITAGGLLMLFNDGTASNNEFDGLEPGANRIYSAVSAYSIDAAAQSAREMLRFDDMQSISSPYCSSVYEATGLSLLVNYAMDDGGKSARLLGLDANRNIVFDFVYPSPFSCATSWNAIPVPFDRLIFK